VARSRGLRTFVPGLTAALVVLIGGPSAAAAAPVRAQIISYQAVPRELGPNGGLVVIQADVRNALECRLKLLSHQGFAVVYSHAPSYGCQSGYFTPHVEVGANTSSVGRTISFEVIVTNATSKAGALVPLRIAGRS
jgi:hypothetical protein